MAFWGLDIAQNDGFCKIYGEYMDMYDVGGEPCGITSQILKKYGGEDSHEMHNVYFAVAKAEHKLCALSPAVLEKVRDIVESGADGEYYRTLGFSEKEISEREKFLLKFLKELEKPCKKARKRKVSSYNHIKRLPKGELGYYEAEGAYYGFAVLDSVYEGRLLALTDKLESAPKSAEDILGTPALTVIWLLLHEAPRGCRHVDKINIEENFNGRGGMFICKPLAMGLNFVFDPEECHKRKYFEFPGRKIRNLLHADDVPMKFLCEETRGLEEKIVREVWKNPASRFAMEQIKAAITF